MIDFSSSHHYLTRLLAIGNNVSALGVFLLHTQGMSPQKVHRLILMSSLSCLTILVLFMLFGTRILDFFGITISSFQIAGGLLLGRVGLQMINNCADQNDEAKPQANDSRRIDARFYSAAVVPIGIPLTIGAGTLSAVVLFSETAISSGTALSLLVAIFVLVLVNYFIFRFSRPIVSWLGLVGVDVFIKLMGLFTLAIGVEFIAQGLSAIYNSF